MDAQKFTQANHRGSRKYLKLKSNLKLLFLHLEALRRACPSDWRTQIEQKHLDSASTAASLS